MFDLESLSLAELKQLKKRVDAAIDDYAEREKRKALAEIEAFARERGLSLSDIVTISAKRSRGPVAPKYANPEDPSQTWTGRGRRPAWVLAALEAGKSMDDMAI